MMELESRIQILEDREAIKELKARYCYLVDSRDWDAWAALFTEDAQGTFVGFGTADGRAGFLKYAHEVIGPQFPFLVHMVHNPIIEVNGDEALGRWYFDVPCVSSAESEAFGGGKAGWLQGMYDERYRRTADQWLISAMTASFHYAAAVDEGWAKAFASTVL